MSGWSMDVHRLIFSTTVARSDRILASGVCVGGIEGSAALGLDANSLISAMVINLQVTKMR